MGKLSKYLFGIMAAAMLAGCSDDAISPDDNGGGNVVHGPNGAVYMQVSIVPSFGSTASRGETTDPDGDGYTTSSNGVEVGYEDENRIFNVMLILAGPNQEFISYALVGGLGNNNENVSGLGQANGTTYDPKNNSVTVNASFDRASIEAFYDHAKENGFSPREVYVYALCNYTQDMLNSIKTAKPMASNWTNLNQRVDEYSAASGIPNTGVSVLSTAGGIYMANAVKAKKEFPKTTQDWDAFSDEKNPFNLSGISTVIGEGLSGDEIDNTGSVKVERGIARFDFADGSELGNNTYIIGDQLDEENPDQKVNTLKVKLVRMCLVNMSNRFFYLRHMANTNGEEGQLAAATLPNDGWVPTDPVEALANTFFLCVAETPWSTGGEWIDNDQIWKPGTMNWESGNWVIDPYYTFKSTFGSLSDDDADAVSYEDYFNFPLGNRGFNQDNGTINNNINNNVWGITPTARIAWYTSTIDEVLSGREDQDYGGWHPQRYDYHIWRYVTENTIPSVANQKNAISTGIVFKGLLLPGDNCPEDLKAVLTTGSYTYKDEDGKETQTVSNPNLYLYDEVLYVSWPNVEAEALAQKAGSPLYNAVYGNTTMTAAGKLGELEGWDQEVPTHENACAARLYEYWQEKNHGNFSCNEYYEFRTKIVGNGFAIYQHSANDDLSEDDAKDDLVDAGNENGGYFCYYYYWNRHNDNARNGVMGPMEFQVVRNNVYKLAVTEISKLGHPRRTSNDPDPEEPKKDDEESKLYFKVQVEVLPWTVRVNYISF